MEGLSEMKILAGDFISPTLSVDLGDVKLGVAI